MNTIILTALISIFSLTSFAELTERSGFFYNTQVCSPHAYDRLSGPANYIRNPFELPHTWDHLGNERGKINCIQVQTSFCIQNISPDFTFNSQSFTGWLLLSGLVIESGKVSEKSISTYLATTLKDKNIINSRNSNFSFPSLMPALNDFLWGIPGAITGAVEDTINAIDDSSHESRREEELEKLTYAAKVKLISEALHATEPAFVCPGSENQINRVRDSLKARLR
ncbi:MAG: hypothetical protein SGJ18_08430 [Pseudomonadota bacterium]|nr:hypothetical protein [Pseudomonadota bacterium]